MRLRKPALINGVGGPANSEEAAKRCTYRTWLVGPTLTKALIVILLAAMTTAAQDYQIRTRVDLVVVPVTVKNSGGQLVSSLTKADFRIYENGKEQEISNFTIDPVPLSAAVLV